MAPPRISKLTYLLVTAAVGCAATPASSGSGGNSGSGGSGTGASATGGVTGSSGGAVGTGGASSGGAPGSGGSAGATASGGAGGAGAGGCGTALFCDDFESYPSGVAPGGTWKTTLNGGTVTVDDTQKHSGSKSVKFTTQSKSGTKTAFMKLMAAPLFPVDGNVFYGRMMFQLQAGPTASVHWTFIQAGGVVPNTSPSYHAVYRYGGQMPVTQGSTFLGNQLMASYDTPDSYNGTGPSTDCYQQSNMVVAPMGTGKWSCVEWKFDGPNNALQIWLDSKAIPELTVTGHSMGCVNQSASYTWLSPTFSDLELGWESYQQDDARTIWIDDVAVSKTQIGCPAD